MPRLTALPLDQAPAAARPSLEGVQKQMGFVPNVFKTLAQAPAVLNGYLQFAQAMGKSSLSLKERETIALATSQVNGCDYCLAAHTLFSAKAGLSSEAINRARDGELDAFAIFARQVSETRGQVTDAQIAAAKAAGMSEATLIEVVAQVALLTLTNLINNVAQTEIDFPKA
jgi:uncharacterized peroxidase-related enzyme